MPASHFCLRNAASGRSFEGVNGDMAMSENEDQRRDDPEARAVSGSPDAPPQQADHTQENDRELLRQGEREDEEETVSGKPAADGEGGSDQPGTTLPGYG